MIILKSAVLGLAAAAVLAVPAVAGTGTAEFFGTIAANGVIKTGSGITSSSKSAGAGLYVLTFPREIRNCVWTGNVLGTVPGVVTIGQVASQLNKIEVRTFSPSGVRTNHVFSLLVKCQD